MSDPLEDAFRSPRETISTTYPMLEEPFYGWTRDGKTPHRPTTREVLRDVVDGVNPLRGITRLVPFSWVLFYVAITGAAGAYVIRGPRPATLAFIAGAIAFISTIYNTVHHAQTEGPGDPYGPHLGWLGTVVSFETEQRTNTDIPEWRYKTLVKLMSHVGIPINGYEEFRRTQSVEPIGHFLLRATFAQVFYAAITHAIGGTELVLTWYAAVFVFLSLLRDFNWHGHGGSRASEPAANRPGPSYARNQGFYGFVAGEWHGNHHLCPRSARAGDGPWQPDLAFAIIRLLHRIGIVASYHEELPSKPKAPSAPPAPRAREQAPARERAREQEQARA